MRQIEALQSWILRGLLFLLPLFFLPATADSFELNKLALLVVATLLAAALWAASLSGGFKVRATPLDLPVFLLVAAIVVSALLATPNKIDAFLLPGTATAAVFGGLLYFLVVQNSKTGEAREALFSALIAGGAASALILALAGIGGFSYLVKILQLPAWLAQPTFTTAGDLFSSIITYLVLLPLAVRGLIRSRGTFKTTALTVFAVLLVVGALVAAFHALPGKPTQPRVLPVSAGWSIALEVFKKSPILGIGPGNFAEAFARFRPVEYNATPVWNLRFPASSNWYFHTFTTTGILGFAALLFLLWRLWKNVYKGALAQGLLGLDKAQVSLLLLLLAFFLISANTLLLSILFFLLASVTAGLAKDFWVEVAAAAEVSHLRKANILPVGLTVFFLLILAGTAYFGGRVYGADLAYRRALSSLAKNDGTATYNAMIEAVSKNSRRDVYRISYSQVNLALANAIAANPPAGQELSEGDRQTISQLVQQAIREAKAAVALHQRKAGNWENLARIYQALIPFAQGADQWTTAAYQQAIALDPVNPVLRIAYGGVFYSLGKYEDAVKVFELAVAAKPDFANAHYNLAAALREKGDTERAVREMEAVLQLVQANSQDYQIAQTELEALRGKLAQEREATSSGETLEVAETPTEPILEPPLELEGAEPPATEEAKPIPAPRVSPSPSPQL